MIHSFYTAATGARAQQARLDIIANNFANVNTNAYKTQSAGFVDLLYENIRQDGPPQTGSGARVEKTDLIFTPGGMSQSGRPLDYYIQGEGFFAVRRPGSDEILYTRDGAFVLSQNNDDTFTLRTTMGYDVLDAENNPIIMESEETEPQIGVFRFNTKEGFICVGNNLYRPAEKDGPPITVEEPQLRQGVVEMANVDLAKEMSRLVETQRAYQFVLRMMQTSDEVEQTVNGLRQ